MRAMTWCRGLVTILAVGVTILLPWGVSAKPKAAERGPHLSGSIELLSQLMGGPPAGETPTARLRCTTPTSSAGNILSDCAFVAQAPHNEPHLAVNPTNPNNLVAGANGYEFYFVGRTLVARSLNDFRVSFDGGHTWTTGFLEMGGFNTATDPVFAFDTLGNAYYANIGYHTSQGGAAASNGSVLVAKSTDGGATYALPVMVHRGVGNLGRSFFDDKEWLTVDTWAASPLLNRIYVTWSGFESGPGGGYLRSAIWFASSADGGRTWSPAQEISGSGPFCVTQVTGPAFQCDENQFSVPAVGPGGVLYVAFENTNTAAPDFRSQYLVVKSTDGGATWSAPVRVADLTDGVNDYPMNISGRQTLTGVQYRVNSAGNITVGPDGTIYVVWSDNRNGSAGATNTDVFMATSTDGGATWSAAIPVSNRAGDQFFPWVAVAGTTINVAYYDDYYDAATGVQLGVTLARSTNGGATWTQTGVHTALSNPNRSRWFSGATNGQSLFIGDYNGLALDSTGRAYLNWTDLRLDVAPGLQIPPNRVKNENIFFWREP